MYMYLIYQLISFFFFIIIDIISASLSHTHTHTHTRSCKCSLFCSRSTNGRRRGRTSIRWQWAGLHTSLGGQTDLPAHCGEDHPRHGHLTTWPPPPDHLYSLSGRTDWGGGGYDTAQHEYLFFCNTHTHTHHFHTHTHTRTHTPIHQEEEEESRPLEIEPYQHHHHHGHHCIIMGVVGATVAVRELSGYHLATGSGMKNMWWCDQKDMVLIFPCPGGKRASFCVIWLNKRARGCAAERNPLRMWLGSVTTTA